MRNILNLVYLLLLALMCTSCSMYESKVPASDPAKSTINPTITGSWKIYLPASDSTANESRYISLIPFNDKEYVVRNLGVNSDSTIADISISKLHNTMIGDYEILNVGYLSENPDEPEWVFFSYKEITEDSLTVYYLSSDFSDEKFDSSKKLNKHFKSKSDSLQEFFIEYCKAKRIKEIPANMR